MFKLLESSITKSPEGRETDVNFRYLVVHKATGHKVRVHIRSNSYAAQCSAIAQVWNKSTLSWNEVATLLPAQMETDHGLYYQANGTDERHFEEDYERLLAFADHLLS